MTINLLVQNFAIFVLFSNLRVLFFAISNYVHIIHIIIIIFISTFYYGIQNLTTITKLRILMKISHNYNYHNCSASFRTIGISKLHRTCKFHVSKLVFTH